MLLAGCVAAAVLIGLTAPAALSSTATWTVSPGGRFDIGPGPLRPVGYLTDTVTGARFKCGALYMAGHLTGGTGLRPVIGKITSAYIAHGCRDGRLNLGVSKVRPPWGIRVGRYDMATATASGVFASVELAAAGDDCTASLTGLLHWTHVNGSGDMGITGAGTLRAGNVTGCGGLISDGDAVTYSTHVAMSRHQVITSP